MDNTSTLVFTLSGLNGTEKYRIPLFVVTFLCYSLIWVANVTIIVTIIMDKNFHEPMYICLCNLCVNGLFGTAGFFPKFLSDLLSSAHVISYAGCLLQGFVVHASLTADLSILLLMAFDRYVAICRPLMYHSVMTRQRLSVMIFFSWFIPLQLNALGPIATSTIRLCGSHIPKLYCINFLVNRLACTPFIADIIIPSFNYTFYLGHFVVVFLSYINIIKTCLKSREGWDKFMKTCLPHIICLIIFTVSITFDLMYVRFGSNLAEGVKNFLAIECLIIPPLFNPVIYGLKLTKIRNRLLQTVRLNPK
ncbi:olfactory receptor 52E8-like [Periophthalmus magnuspinnatus]|nr:olfactory receptor 52E8-like [Periophthalmus magnuspinnatus]